MRKSHFTLVPERGAGSAELKIGLRSAPCLADHRTSWNGGAARLLLHCCGGSAASRGLRCSSRDLRERTVRDPDREGQEREHRTPNDRAWSSALGRSTADVSSPSVICAGSLRQWRPPPPCELRAILALTSDRSIGRAQRYAWQPFAPVEAARGEEAGGGADLPQPPRHIRRPPLARISPSAGRPGLPRPRRPATSSSERPSRPCRARACSRGAPSLPARCPGFRACCGFR